MQQQDMLYHLDAETKSGELRVTTFAFYFEDLITDLSTWLADRGLMFSDLSYAIIYRTEDLEPVADIVLGEDGIAVFVPREPNNNPLHKLVLKYRKWRNSRWQ